MREIVPDVFTWQWFSEPHGYDFNGHLICLPGGNLCIDPVEPSPRRAGRARAPRRAPHSAHQPQSRARREPRAGAHRARAPRFIRADAGYASGQGAELDDELHVGERIGPLDGRRRSGQVGRARWRFIWPAAADPDRRRSR